MSVQKRREQKRRRAANVARYLCQQEIVFCREFIIRTVCVHTQ